MVFEVEYNIPPDNEVYTITIEADNEEEVTDRLKLIDPGARFIEIQGEIHYNADLNMINEIQEYIIPDDDG